MTKLLATVDGPTSGTSVTLPPNLAPGYVQITALPSSQGFRTPLFATSPVFDSNIELFPPWPGELVARVPALNTPWFWRQVIDRRTIFVPQPRPSNPPSIELFVVLIDSVSVEVFGD